MAPGRFRFEGFCLDPHDRRLTRGDAAVELNTRYLDALALLVSEQGRLVSKARFLEEVWRGVPVTDEALTQCIRTLRRQLGDDAARPRFIETVPKHGYRFIAPVEQVGQATEAVAARSHARRRFFLLGGAGMAGGGLAGLIGGLFYGFAGASQALLPSVGGVSVVLVMVCLTIVVAMIGGAGVGFGIAAAALASGRAWGWSIVGGALGGLLVGAIVKLLGIDAFNLLFGRSPGDITGPFEGVLLGGAVGLGGWLAAKVSSLGRGITAAGVTSAAVGAVIPLLGGRLMGGSLDLLAHHFPGSQLRIAQIGALFGERGFGLVSQVVTGGLEGLLFGGCIVGAMMLAQRTFGAEDGRG